MKIVNPIEYSNWDHLLLANDNATFFHTSTWAKVLSESYNYKPCYFTKIQNSKLKFLFPVMEINSFITGKRGVCLPFTDLCPPIVFDGEDFTRIFKNITDIGKKNKWKAMEIRGGDGHLNDIASCDSFYIHALKLDSNFEDTFSKFRSSTKRNIKKSIKENVNVKISHSFNAVKEFYRLNCLTRRDHGLPPQPFYFFKKIYDHIIFKKKGFVVLASYQNKNIAGAVYFHFGQKAIYKYGASDKSYQHLRPNNLVMWEAIKWYAENGFEIFSFGRTDLDHDGLLQFKRGWGTKEEKIYYYKYDIKKDAFITSRPKIKTSYNIFNKLPLPLLKLTGTLLYRHVG